MPKNRTKAAPKTALPKDQILDFYSQGKSPEWINKQGYLNKPSQLKVLYSLFNDGTYSKEKMPAAFVVACLAHDEATGTKNLEKMLKDIGNQPTIWISWGKVWKGQGKYAAEIDQYVPKPQVPETVESKVNDSELSDAAKAYIALHKRSFEAFLKNYIGNVHEQI